MKFHILIFLGIILIFGNFSAAQAQVDSVIGQISSSEGESIVGGISGDGRLVVFSSTGNVATENPRNADGNREIFLFDYAQRRIFQITDTKSLRTNTAESYIFSNIKVSITNLRPVISNDGRWIAFGSNATTSTPTAPNATNPGSFDAESFTNATTGENPLTLDANTEMWLYEVPPVAPADLSAGDEIPVINLGAGNFIRVTNTPASRTPFPGSANNLPIIADDNRDASINDNGNYIAFVSSRDLVTPGNAAPEMNDEIFTYVRNANTVRQITQTPRGTLVAPIYNASPTISGGGLRVVFLSNAETPIVGMMTSNNADRSPEVFYTDLNPDASPVPTLARQVTVTTRTNPGDLVNLLDLGRRMSRDGRYIAFDSFAELETTNPAGLSSFALYLYDTTLTTNAFRRITPRSDADTTATGGDVPHFPGFTDTDAAGLPATLVFETRLNVIANGTIAATNDGGLNPNTTRPAQIYSTPISATVNYSRLTRLPSPIALLPSVQPIPSNSIRRMTFSLALTELGTGNSDLSSEAYYFLLPVSTTQTPASFSFSTGASRIPVSASPVPTPSPTATPSPTPTPSPSPSPSPSPTPVTPPAVQGVSPGMLAILDYNTGINNPVVARTAVGSIERRFTLPIELSGVTMTINGVACGLRSVSQRQIVFVVPPGLSSGSTGAQSFPVVVNNNGVVFRGSITIVPARPDIFTFTSLSGGLGRALLQNVTNTVPRTEPFNVTTLRIKGGRRVPTVLRLFLTGVESVPNSIIRIRIGNREITPVTQPATPVLREPGIYSIDFTLPPELLGAGDVPVVVSVVINGVTYQSRLDDTAPRTRIL